MFSLKFFSVQKMYPANYFKFSDIAKKTQFFVFFKNATGREGLNLRPPVVKEWTFVGKCATFTILRCFTFLDHSKCWAPWFFKYFFYPLLYYLIVFVTSTLIFNETDHSFKEHRHHMTYAVPLA